MARILIALYRILVEIFMWPAGLALSRHPNFAGTVRSRLGLALPDVPGPRPLVWVHAASVGEVKAVSGLLKALRQEKSGITICLSAMTATGRQVASSIRDIDLVIPFPFDSARVMRKYMKRLSPDLVVIVETELWPGMILAARGMGIPVAVVNARMTDRSFRRYGMLSSPVRRILGDVEVLAMADADARRFSLLGAGRVSTLGNLKLDSLNEADPEKREQVRSGLGIGPRPVFIAGSIREGEEEMIVDAVRGAALCIPGLFTILVPRHPRQTALLKELARQSPFAWCMRSRMEKVTDLVIVDTMGELFGLYGASDMAFVGGSLVNLGGQNILEPLSWGVPTIHGPHMDNFTWALEAVGDNTVKVKDAGELRKVMADIYRDPAPYLEAAARARSLLEKRRGVTQRYVHALGAYLP